MKFGRRLIAEAARSKKNPFQSYFDYKACKKAIKADVAAGDAQGSHFSTCLVSELQKVSAYYSTRVSEAEATFQSCQERGCAADLAELRAELQELIKYVALNYLAVVKAIKKRNRHLKETFGSSASTSLDALDLLLGEVFFTSPRLASLSTQAEVLARDLQSSCGSSSSCSHHSEPSQPPSQQEQQQLLEEYSCPVCLDTLHNPVVLTCAHRFCWGCLVAHCTSCREVAGAGHSSKAAGSVPHVSSYRVLEDIACDTEPEAPTFYPCPICRKPQILDIDSLQVDTHLEVFVNNLQSGTTTTTVTETTTTSAPEHLVLRPRTPEPAEDEPWGVIPPQPTQHKGKLCVLLDLDGTLVSSFTPKRAPRLPAYVRTHVVGVGSKLNPQGVFVVERPGLTEFLEQLSAFAEVIVFTAGLEDYASPIIDAIDPDNKFFAGRIYRNGTLRTEHYQCVKDMARLNRDLKRTVLVDDTPLAFLHQPDNGVPVLGFRGDPDDRLLMEAVLPLLQVLDREPDVMPVLHRRFDMGSWFKRHGFAVDQIVRRALANAAAEREMQHKARSALKESSSGPTHTSSPASNAPTGPVLRPACTLPAVQPAASPSKEVLFLTDFDQTLTDWDAGERLCEQLAPELKPMLVGVECPASHVPMTNSVLAEMQRRGVSRDALLSTLNDMGAQELPQATRRMLDSLKRARVDVKIVSDANSIFILQVLSGARVADKVEDIITNPANFERLEPPPTSPGSPRYRLVVSPWHGGCGRDGHRCSMCPSNMCKGQEVRALRQAGTYRRIVYAGDGANDVCAALCLGGADVVLARAGRPLAEYLQRAQRGEAGHIKPQARWYVWESHEELDDLVTSLTGA